MRVRASRPVIALTASVVVLFAACSPGATPTPQPTPSAAPSAVAPTPTTTTTPTPLPTDAPTPTPAPATVAPATACLAANLAARITQWEGAMGHLIAHVELTNNGAACLLASKVQPQLVDGHGSVLIDGAAGASPLSSLLATGGVVKTLVQDGNYCGPVPLAPVSVAFVLPAGAGRLVATPLSPTDTSGVPGCLGAAGSAGSIEMQPWAP